MVGDSMLVQALTRLQSMRPPVSVLTDPDSVALFSDAIALFKLDTTPVIKFRTNIHQTGASAETLAKRGDMFAIQARGWWKTPDSVRGYVKAVRVANQLS